MACCRAGLPTGVAATTAAPPFVTDPVWNVSAVVRLGPLGNDSFFYVIAIVSDGDTFVLRSQSPPLEKWHRHFCSHTTAVLLCVFCCVVVVLGRAVTRNAETLGYLKKKKQTNNLLIDFLKNVFLSKSWIHTELFGKFLCCYCAATKWN